MLALENFEWIPCLPAGACLCILACLQQEATCDSSQVRSRKTPCQRLVCAKGPLCKEHSILLKCPVVGKSAQTTGTEPRRPSELQNDKWTSGSNLFNIFHSQKNVLSSPSTNYKDFNKYIQTAYYMLVFFVLETPRTNIKFEVNYKPCIN